MPFLYILLFAILFTGSPVFGQAPTKKPVAVKKTQPTKQTQPTTKKPKPRKPATIYRIKPATKRDPLVLVRIRQIREVIQMLEWAGKKGWLPNLDIDQLRLVDQWLQGRIAKLLGIEWERGLWIKLYATNRQASPVPWPTWLPEQFKRYQKYFQNLHQAELVVEIPVRRSFLLSFAIGQALGLIKLPYKAELFNNYQTYWVTPPFGMSIVIVLGKRYIYLKVLWPHDAIHTKQGRLALWKGLVVPSLTYKGKPLQIAQQRIKKEYTPKTIVVTYLAVAKTLTWLGQLPSHTIQQLSQHFKPLEAYSIGGRLSLSSTDWKAVQWRKKPPTKKPRSKKDSKKIRQIQGQNKAPKNKGTAGNLPKSKPPLRRRFVPPGPPRGLPLSNPLTKRNSSTKGLFRITVGKDGKKALKLSRSVLSPLPLVSVTWPKASAVFLGSFTQSNQSRGTPGVFIRRLWKSKQRTTPQNDIIKKLMILLTQQWQKEKWLAGDWVNPKQLALWTLESLLFRQWIIWGELSAIKPSTKQTNKTKPEAVKKAPSSQPGQKPTTQKKPRIPRRYRAHMTAVGRWDSVAQQYLQPLLMSLASNKGLSPFGPTPTLRFKLANDRPPLMMTWRGDLWFMADSPTHLQRALQLYTRKQPGPFLERLPTDSVLYKLNKQRQWNIVHLRPTHFNCLMRRALSGQLAGVLTRQIESVEIASLQQKNKTTLLLKMRWYMKKQHAVSWTCVRPATTWRHLTSSIVAPFQRSFLWQVLERLNQLLALETKIRNRRKKSVSQP